MQTETKRERWRQTGRRSERQRQSNRDINTEREIETKRQIDKTEADRFSDRKTGHRHLGIGPAGAEEGHRAEPLKQQRSTDRP